MTTTAQITPVQSTNAATTQGVEKLQSRKACTVAEPMKFVKRIASTTFTVNIRFNERGSEPLEQKLLRIIESEVSSNA
jgi:hypothetical protein